MIGTGERAEATGIGSASSIVLGSRYRVRFPDLRTTSPTEPRWAPRRSVSTPPRYRARARKLTLDQEATIRALAASKSLRALATDFGVSHETIRAVVQQEQPAPG